MDPVTKGETVSTECKSPSKGFPPNECISPSEGFPPQREIPGGDSDQRGDLHAAREHNAPVRRPPAGGTAFSRRQRMISLRDSHGKGRIFKTNILALSWR